jgi:hypothetical protein
MKEYLSLIAVTLTFAGYIPYVLDTVRKETTPHIYTWFVWGLVAIIAFGLQVGDHAGPGAFVTLAAALVCFMICGLAIRYGSRSIATIDTVFFALALIALVLWLFIDQALVAIIIVSAIDVLGFAPTMRKSWHRPYEETLVSYQLNTLRFVLALFALEQYGLVSVLYPLTLVLVNGLFSLFLIIRRRSDTPRN